MGREDAEASVKDTAQASTEGTASDKNADNEGFTYNEKTAKSMAESITIYDVLKGTKAKQMDSEVIGSHTGNPAAGHLNTTKSICTISVKDLLDIVKENYPEILPDSFREYYGVTVPKADNLLFSERDTESVSNRSLLANAFESIVKDDLEKKKLAEYRENISQLDAQEEKLAQLNAQIKELSFAPGKRDKAKIQQLRDEATKTANRIGIYDQRLLRLEASAPLQKVLEREKKCFLFYDIEFVLYQNNFAIVKA